MYQKKTFLILVILAITFFAIGFNFNYAQAQETVSKSVAAMGGVDSYDVSETNIVYNFNELSLFSTWNYIQYPYARFTPYPSGYFRVKNQVSDYSYYPNYITNDYPYYNFGGVDVQFTQSVRNLSFTTVGVNGGNFKVDIYQNGALTQQVTIPAACFGYENCFTDLRGWQNLTRISIHSINDPAGLGFDDFSFTLGGTPTPTPTPTPQNRAPIGYLDAVREDGLAVGWTLDPDNQNVSNPVHFYVDGTSSAHFVGGMVASMLRQDLILAGYQGQHGFEFSLPERFKDGNPHTLYVYGLDLTTGQPLTLLTGTPKTFTLHSVVQSVAFKQITNETINGEPINSEVDRPVYGHPSQRIFPDKKFPEDTVNHKRVRVKAVVGKPNINVYFKNFDVDDPSSDNTIDDTGSNGNDNREGRIIGQSYPQTAAGILSGLPCPNASNCVMSSTNADGEAIVYFTVTKQPGDNFRVAASTDETYLNGVKVAGTELADANNILLSNTGKAKQTELLTVWRKLHMEIDSMGEAAGNFETGFFTGKGTYVGSQPKWIEIYSPIIFDRNAYKQTLAVDNDENTRLSYGGRIIFAGLHSLQVLDSRRIENSLNMEPRRQEILVQSLSGNVYLRPNHPFKLYDDDDFNSDDASQKDGDNGENVELLSDTLSRMRDSDNVDVNSYAAACILPEYQWAELRGLNNKNLPFKVYLPGTHPNYEEHRAEIVSNRGSLALGSDDFWIGYLLVAYQQDSTIDADFYGGAYGVSPAKNNTISQNLDVYTPSLGMPAGGIGAVIFIETMRDAGLKLPPRPPYFDPLYFDVTLTRTRTAPHEVGHQFGLAHNNLDPNGGIMSYTGNLYFTSNHIDMLRWRVKSPGEGE